jgi:hypothetical protein
MTTWYARTIFDKERLLELLDIIGIKYSVSGSRILIRGELRFFRNNLRSEVSFFQEGRVIYLEQIGNTKRIILDPLKTFSIESYLGPNIEFFYEYPYLIFEFY